MEVLKNLSANEVRALRERFRDPLPVDEFEAVLVEFVRKMPHVDIAKLRLQELFNDIDANGDSTVSWDEFTMFIIDAAALEATLSTSGRDAVIKQYRPVATLEDEVPGSVAEIKFVKELNRVVKVVHRDKYSKVRLCLPEANLPVTMELPRTESMVLTTEYIPARPGISTSNVLCASMNDNVIRYYDVSRHMLSTSTVIKCRRTMPVAETQTALHWDADHYKLMMGSRSGVVSVVNPDDIVPLNTERIHTSVISSMVCSNGILFTASLDNSIKLIDLNRGMVKHTIEGPHSHQQGVFKIELSEQSQLLFSAGLEPNVFVHSLSNAKMKPQKMIDKNRPHHGRIVGLHVLRDSPQVVSADTSGLVKIWDSRTLGCVQTISTVKDDVFNIASGGGSVLSAIGYVEKNKQLVISGRTTKVFAYDTASKPHLSDDIACTLVVFNPAARNFLTVHGTTVKTWDGQTGALRGVHHNVTESDITAVCLVMPRMRKFIAGTYKGDLHAFGFAMCSPLGDFPQAYTTASATVVALAFLDGFKENRNPYVLTVFKKEVVLVPDTEEHVQRSVLKLHCFEPVLEEFQAKSLTVTENKTVLIGTEGNRVYVCDLSSFSLSCVVQPAGLVGDIAFIAAFPDIYTPFMAQGREAAGHRSLQATFAGGVGARPSSVATSRQGPQSFASSVSEVDLGASTMFSASVNAALSASTQPYFKRLGAGIAFVSDSTGSISAVLLHSAAAMETLVTWKNLQSGHRKKKKRHQHSSNPHERPDDDPQDLAMDASGILQPSSTLHLGEVVNMADDSEDEDDDDGSSAFSNPTVDVIASGSPTKGRGKKANGGVSFNTAAPAMDPTLVTSVLGSRPNSAVAAYFKSPTSRHDLAPVVTTMAFLADGHVLVTGDENGYVTSWDVDLIVRKAARVAAKSEVGDAWLSLAPSPIASWKAHHDEVVSVSEAFGEAPKSPTAAAAGPPGSRGNSAPAGDTPLRTGSVIATASVDRNIVLWTTDGVSLGNLAQGRIPAMPTGDDETVVMPEGITPYRLDDPPANGWSITDKVRVRREVVAAFAGRPQDQRRQTVVFQPLPGKALSVGTRSAFAEKLAAARQAVSNKQATSGSTVATRKEPTPPPASAGSAGTSTSPSGVPLVPTRPAHPSSAGAMGAGVFFTELEETHHQQQQVVSGDYVLASTLTKKVPVELRGIVDPSKFVLPQLPKPRMGRRAIVESASARGMPASTRTPRTDSSTVRRDAEAMVTASTARGMVTLGCGDGAPAITLPIKEESATSSLAKHLSSATQKYLHRLGFDDNPQENPEQKQLRHKGRVVLTRAAGAAEGEPSLRVV